MYCSKLLVTTFLVIPIMLGASSCRPRNQAGIDVAPAVDEPVRDGGAAVKAPLPVEKDMNALPPGAITRLGIPAIWNDPGGLPSPLAVRALHYAADGKTLRSITGEADLTVNQWDMQAQKQLRRDKLEIPVERRAMRWSPDGKTVATVDRKGQLQLWSVATKQLLWSANTAITIRKPDSLRWSRGGPFLEDLADAPSVLLEFSPDGRAVAGLTGVREINAPIGADMVPPTNGKIVIWETEAGKVIGHVDAHYDLRRLALWPRGQSFGLIVASLRDLVGCDPSGELRFKCDSPDEPNGHRAISRLVVSPDGKQLAVEEEVAVSVGDSLGLPHREIRIWRLGKKPIGQLIPAHASTAPLFSPDGRLVAFGTADGVGIWDAHSNKLGSSRGNFAAECVAFAPDATVLATGNQDGTILLFDVAQLFRPPIDAARKNQ